MVFSSLLFLFRFLPAVLLVYYLAPGRFRNLILFLSSLFFYAWGEPVYVGLLLFSSALDYLMGRGIGFFRETGHRLAMRLCLAASLAANMGLLLFFKYADFFLSVIGAWTHREVPVFGLSLPIGISFYTFQTLSYTIDVYWDKVKPQRSFVSFGAYVSLFPQLIAGPIVRYQTIAQELEGRTETVEDFSSGAVRFAAGLAKKVLIANSVGSLFDEIAALSGDELSMLTAWLGVIAYTFQIYFDFSGYSDMAIGLGRMFGFHFEENFEHPYESCSITEFWRRWHISLGSWFKEYVYIPLGGNRKGLGRQMINIAVVWFLTGLWHGASVNFILWGVYYGVLLAAEKLFLLKWLESLGRFFRHLYTMTLVTVGWVLFCYPELSGGRAFLWALVGRAGGGLADERGLFLVITNLALLVFAAVGSTRLPFRLAAWIARAGIKEQTRPAVIEIDELSDAELLRMVFEEEDLNSNGKSERAAGVGMLWYHFCRAVLVAVCLFLSAAFLVSGSFNPFLYFRF